MPFDKPTDFDPCHRPQHKSNGEQERAKARVADETARMVVDPDLVGKEVENPRISKPRDISQ